jgi:DNA-directed RNA polymerase subunit RPC12/RpoP
MVTRTACRQRDWTQAGRRLPELRRRGGDMEIVLGVVVVLLLGGTGAYFYLLRSRAPKEEVFYYYRCTKCRRKMRYVAKQANSKGMCPQCKQRFVFPAVTNSKA